MTIKDKYEYDPETGIFYWRTASGRGRVAGCTYSNGYHNLRWNGKLVGAHRLAWLYIHGEIPHQIDHINGDPSDNRIANLRPSTQAQNRLNSRTRRDSRSGLKGIHYRADRNKWRATIGPRGAVKHLGYFETQELAREAYREAAIALYGEFARV